MRVLYWVRDIIIWNLRSSGVTSVGKAPDMQATMGLGVLHKVATQGKCTECGRPFWSWRDRSTCNSWKCYRAEKDRQRSA